MGKLSVFKNIFLILLLVGVVYMAANYAEPVKNMALGMINIEDNNVLGASSSRANEITGKVGSDIGKQVENLKNQAFNIKLGDIFSTLSRAQKIPQDIQAAGEFIREQADNLVNKQ